MITSFIKRSKFLRMLYNKLMNSYRIRGNGNVISSLSFLTGCRFEVRGENNRIDIAPDCRLRDCQFIVKGNNHSVHIDEDCILRELTVWFENVGNSVSIGQGTTTNGKTSISVVGRNGKVSIGKDCMLSSNIGITNTDSHSIIDMSSGERINFERDVSIGNHVWIGKNVDILKGCIISDNVIIGADSLVTMSDNIREGNCCLAGVPAKIVKRNVTWVRE